MYVVITINYSISYLTSAWWAPKFHDYQQTIFTHRHCASFGLFTFWWWRHNQLYGAVDDLTNTCATPVMTSQLVLQHIIIIIIIIIIMIMIMIIIMTMITITITITITIIIIIIIIIIFIYIAPSSYIACISKALHISIHVKRAMWDLHKTFIIMKFYLHILILQVTKTFPIGN